MRFLWEDVWGIGHLCQDGAGTLNLEARQRRTLKLSEFVMSNTTHAADAPR